MQSGVKTVWRTESGAVQHVVDFDNGQSWFEFFPPKTEKGVDKLFEVAEAYKDLQPDWYSVTYGAGGSTRGLRWSSSTGSRDVST